MRPLIHINCAMSADGKIAGSDRKQVRISSQEDKDRVKGLRMKYDAILVGVGTVLADDPHLTVKGRSYDENQVRIIIDPHGRTPDDAAVLNGAARTIMVTSSECARTWENCDILKCPGDFDIGKVMESLYDMGIKSILVEGGGTTISYLFKNDLFDIFTVYIGNMIIGGSEAPTPVDGHGWIKEGGLKLNLKSAERYGDGVVLEYTR